MYLCITAKEICDMSEKEVLCYKRLRMRSIEDKGLSRLGAEGRIWYRGGMFPCASLVPRLIGLVVVVKI